MKKDCILAVDQGTSGTKTVIFDAKGQKLAVGAAPLASSFPKPGHVEQDPLGICQNVFDSLAACLAEFTGRGGDVSRIAACGVSNQRETFLLWDKDGVPLTPAVVWQCKRSVDVCARLKGTETERKIQARTGLIADPYFSGTKLLRLLEDDDVLRRRVRNGEAHFGTVDTWLLFNLCGGAYFTDYTNACRTLFFNLRELAWDEKLLEDFGLQGLNLPQARPSTSSFGESDFKGLLPAPVPILSMIGDSHAAAFGEGCFSPGTAKATLGTGSSILLNVGDRPAVSRSGMVSTICWSAGGRVDYALEGIIVSCGATIKWLRDALGLFDDAAETEAMARAVPDNGGVCIVPAFSGLGAPHWKMEAKAAIFGLDFGADKRHVVRAALESVAFQIKDVVAAMESDGGVALDRLRTDGGMTANAFVMQFLADLLRVEVVDIGLEEVSALGAAYLAGLECGVFDDIDGLAQRNPGTSRRTPSERGGAYADAAHSVWKHHVKGL